MSDIGQRIKEIRKLEGYTQAELARKLGYQPLALSRWERMERSPSLEDLSRLAELLGVNLHWLLTGEGYPYAVNTDYEEAPGILNIPLLGEVGAGPAATYYTPADQEGQLRIPIDFLPPKLSQGLVRQPNRYFALRVTSDSMAPRIQEGDIVLVRRDDWSSGRIIVARIEGTDHVVKRLVETEDRTYLMSENSRYPPIEVDCEVEYLGRVVSILALRNIEE